MDRAEVEALLFRMNAAVPPRRAIDPLLERARAAEWFDSPLASVDRAVADAALDRVKTTLEEQPSLRTFLGLCRGIEEELRPPELEESHEPDPAVLESMRELSRRRRLLGGGPDDEVADVPGPGGGRIHRSTARRLGIEVPDA